MAYAPLSLCSQVLKVTTKPKRSPFSTAAGSGGAYLHSGVAVDLDRCTFVGNKAGEEGLAVLSLGIAENISDAEFDSNSFFCSTGTYGYEMEQTEAEVIHGWLFPKHEVPVCDRATFSVWTRQFSVDKIQSYAHT